MPTPDAKKIPVQIAWRPLDTNAHRLISVARRLMQWKPGSFGHWRVEVGESYAVELSFTDHTNDSAKGHIKSLRAAISRPSEEERVDGQSRWTRVEVGATDLDEAQVMEEAQKVIEHMKTWKKLNKYHLKNNNCHVFATHLVRLIVIGGNPTNMPSSDWTRPIKSRITRRSQRKSQQNTPTTTIGELDAGHDDRSAAPKDKARSPKYRHPVPRRATVYTNKRGERVAKQRPWP